MNNESDQSLAVTPEPDLTVEQRRRFVGASASGGAISLLVFTWLLTAGTFNFGRASFTSNFYDVQARSFLVGKLSMPPSVLSIEGITIHGRSYMYFGPFLAVLHLPLVGVDPALSGHLSGASMVVAYVIAVAGLSRLLWRARPLTGRLGPVSIGEMVFIAFATLGLSAGSILLYLGSDTSVYQETELWATALALLSLSVGMDLLTTPTRRRAASLGALCVSVCMVRLVVGLGVLALTLLIAGAHLMSRYVGDHSCGGRQILVRSGLIVDDPRTDIGIGLLASTVAALGLYALINDVKFGSAFGLPLRHQALVTDGLDPAYTHYAVTHASFNHLGSLPTTLSWYLRPDALDLSRLFPFVNFTPRVWVVGAEQFAGLNPSSSLTATMPVLGVLALVGVAALLFAGRMTRTTAQRTLLVRFRPLLLAMLVGCVGTLTYAGIAHRHLGDLFPAFVLCSVVGGATAIRLLEHRRLLWVSACILGAVGLLASIWINLGLGLINQRIASPSISHAARVAFANSRIVLFNKMFGGPTPQVAWGGPLPKRAQLGTLYIQGSCTALYQDDQGVWNALEQTNAAGHFRLVVDLPSAPTTKTLPLVVNGTTPGSIDLFGLKMLDHHHFIIRYLSENYGRFFAGHDWSTSEILNSPRSGRLIIDVVIDGSPHVELRNASMAIDGQVVIHKDLQIHSSVVRTIGSLPRSVASDPELKNAVASRYPGTLVELPVSTPLCHELRK